MGNDTKKDIKYGSEAHPALRERWTTILTTVLNRDTRKELIELYPPPINFKTLRKPAINEEIIPLMNDTSLKTDKYQYLIQKYISAGLSANAKALTLIINKNQL